MCMHTDGAVALDYRTPGICASMQRMSLLVVHAYNMPGDGITC